MIAYTPYAIFSNSIPIFDINFFSVNSDNITDQESLMEYVKNMVTGIASDIISEDDEIECVSESSAAILQPTVATWYVVLRDIAIVGLMSVLLYIGIRIIIGSANNKAKYKERLMDWIVAICLVFVIHYIMVFIVQMSETLGDLFESSCNENILVPLPTDTKINGEQLKADEEYGAPIWACNFTGYARLIAGGYSDYDTMTAIEFTIIYVVLVIYTVIFTIMYLKRVLYMAFLTMIAPLVALTYPIDKMNDGQAQGFNTWLKEYIFNALLQPFHMLIYSIIIGSVMELAVEYPIYALVALGFLIPAEKMLRKMFGFEKAQTPSTMGALGVAGAGLLMSGVNKLSHRPRRTREGGNEKEKLSQNDKVWMKSDEFDPIGNYAKENTAMPSLITSEIGATNPSQTDFIEGSRNVAGGHAGITGSTVVDEMDRDMNRSLNNMTETDLLLRGGSITNTSPIRKNTNVNNRTKKRTIKNRLGNGLMAVGTRYSNKFAKSHPLRSLRRGITYGIGAGSLGMVGLAAGIASGDLGKTAQYTVTAGTVGGKLANNIGDSLSYENRSNVDVFKQGWYGEEYQDKVRDKAIKEQQLNPDNVQYLRERTSDYRQILKDAYPEYASYGCSNIEDFWAAYQLEQAGASRSSAISTYKLAQRVGDISKSPDAESKWTKRLNEEFGESMTVKTQQSIEQQQLAKEYEIEQKKAESEYQEQYKKVEESKRKNKEAEYQRLKQERDNKYEELKKRNEERQAKIKTMPSQLTKSALESVKIYYKNK